MIDLFGRAASKLLVRSSLLPQFANIKQINAWVPVHIVQWFIPTGSAVTCRLHTKGSNIAPTMKELLPVLPN